MLYELYVENIALIRLMRLPLAAGLNALTGETGAGKSLVIDAVSLLLGGRANDELIRAGENKAIVEGVFIPPFPKQVQELLSADEVEDNLILSRELVRGGRSVARINGRAVNLTTLRAIGRLLINIHGQHEHMLLLEDERQRELLDSYGGQPCHDALEQVGKAFAALRTAEKQVRDFEDNQQERAERMDQLQKIIDEISVAALKPDEYEYLQEEAQRLGHAEQLSQFADRAHQALSQSGGAVELLNSGAIEIRQGAQLDKKLNELYERLNNLYYEADDVANELSAYRDGLDADGYRLDEIEARLLLLSRLVKRYGGSVDAALMRLQTAREEFQQLEDVALSGDLFYRKYQQAEADYRTAASVLRSVRQQTAEKLSKAVTAELRLLAMNQACFSVELTECMPSALGTEGVCFMIRPNIGEPAHPVSKIASGGELSRIVLGLKVILSQLDAVPTLIFDEIDTGMSGRALTAVAERLAMVGRYAQAIAVSHSAMVAAAAGTQIVIEKHEEDGRTVATARTLSAEERTSELARMIAGDKATELTLSQADELLQKLGH